MCFLHTFHSPTRGLSSPIRSSIPGLRSNMYWIQHPGFICVMASSMSVAFSGLSQISGSVIRLNVTNFAFSCSLLRAPCDEVRNLGNRTPYFLFKW